MWLHLINVVRNGIANSGKRQRSKDDADDDDDYHDDEENHRGVIRIPGILSAFLVRTCMILNNPLDPMYKAISSFLLAKPMLVVYGIPEFLRLFHSKDPLQVQLKFISHQMKCSKILSACRQFYTLDSDSVPICIPN